MAKKKTLALVKKDPEQRAVDSDNETIYSNTDEEVENFKDELMYHGKDFCVVKTTDDKHVIVMEESFWHPTPVVTLSQEVFRHYKRVMKSRVRV